MRRIILACCFGALLVACVTPSAQQTDWMQARRACADVGIDPGSSVFEQCVFDLYYSLWNEQHVAER